MDEQQRIDALETKASFQESAISELTMQLFRQEQKIEALEKAIKELGSRLMDMTQPGGSNPGHKPPHYMGR
jgi:SlyX protein